MFCLNLQRNLYQQEIREPEKVGSEAKEEEDEEKDEKDEERRRKRKGERGKKEKNKTQETKATDTEHDIRNYSLLLGIT